MNKFWLERFSLPQHDKFIFWVESSLAKPNLNIHTICGVSRTRSNA